MVAVAIYMLFGDPDCFYWGGFYYCTFSFTVVWLGSMVLKSTRDKLLTILVKIIMGISLFSLVLNLYSFFDVEIFNKINRAYETGGVIVGSVIIFLTHNRNELVKRKVP